MLSCSDKNVTETVDADVVFSSNQISGCNSSGLLKTTNEDSCFSYSFHDTLKIDFCVLGNCCPNSQRFESDYQIDSDTIFISVVDTASDLCDCICNYTMHAELSGLTKEKYLFVSDFSSRYATLNYRESISK